MTTTSGSTTPNNAQLAAQYMAKMKADLAQAEADIAKLQQLFPQLSQLEQQLAFAKEFGWMLGPEYVKECQADVDAQKAAIKVVTDDLDKIDPGLASFDTAIQALENGYDQIANGNVAHLNDYETWEFTGDDIFDGKVVTHKGDLTILKDTLDSIGDAIVDKLQCDECREKMKADGDDFAQMASDSVQAMKWSAKENGVLDAMQTEFGQDMVDLDAAKNAAQTDLDSYHWLDDACSFGTDEAAKERDRAIIRNYYVMKNVITDIEKAIAPEMANVQNEVYATAELSMEKLVDKMRKILLLPNMSNAEKADKVKCLMALALGILAQVQTTAATIKAQNDAMEKKAATFATQMNISDEKAQLAQLQEELSYAKTMGTLMKIAKPLLEVGGMLLAPGVGSFIVMALLMVADEAGLTDKLTNYCASHGMGQIGADCFVGGLELLATVGGGLALDAALSTASKEVAEVVAKETATVVAKTIEETVEKAVTSAEATLGRSLTAAEKDAVKQVVTQAVKSAVKDAATKTVIMTNNQAAATLIPQLLKAAYKEGTVSLAAVIAEASETQAIVAAKEAIKNVAEDIQFFAQAAAKGLDVTPETIDAIANSSANKAVATVADSTEENVAKATERSALRKTLSRAFWTASYAALSDGAISSFTEYELKKHGVAKDSDEWQRVMETIKILESIMASFALMYGTGALQSSIMSGSSTTLLKVGTAASLTGTAAQAIGQAGQADAEMKQADSVQGINQSTVSNEMLNMFMQQFNQQSAIDRKNLENEMAEQASNYTMISHLEDSGKEAAQVLSVSAV